MTAEALFCLNVIASLSNSSRMAVYEIQVSNG